MVEGYWVSTHVYSITTSTVEWTRQKVRAINSLTELEIGVDNFLMQYRNLSHSTTHKSLAQLFKSRLLRTNLKCIDSAEVTYETFYGYRVA